MSYDLVIRNGRVVDGSGLGLLPRRRGRQRRPDRRDRPYPRTRRRRSRCRRPRRHSGIHRRAHASGRAGLLGSAGHQFLLARRDHRRHGQLWFHPGSRLGGRPAARDPEPRASRRHFTRRDGRRHRLVVDDLQRIPRRRRRPAQRDQLRRQHRSQRTAHLCHGRAGVRGGGDRRRSGGDEQRN